MFHHDGLLNVMHGEPESVALLTAHEVEQCEMSDDVRQLSSRPILALPVREPQLGLTASLSFVVGCIIGSGIFFTPVTAFTNAGSVGLSLVLWVVTGIISIFGAFVYVELGTAVPKSGADYSYALHVGWRTVGGAFMLLQNVIANPAFGALLIVTFGEYSVEAMAHLLPPDILAVKYWIVRVLGASVMILLGTVNCYAVDSYSSFVQIVVTSAKLLSLGIVVLFGMWALAFGDGLAHFSSPFAGSHWQVGPIVLASYSVVFCYGGYDVLNTGLSDVKNPRRNLPLAVFIGLSISIAVYVLVNVAFFAVLTREQMSQANVALLTVFARVVAGPQWAWLMSACVALFILGAGNGLLFASSRYMRVAAEEEHLPAIFSAVNVKENSPRVAVAYVVLASILLSFADFNIIVSSIMFAGWLQKIVTCIVYLKIRLHHVQVDEGVIRFPLVFVLLLLTISIFIVVVTIVTEFASSIAGLTAAAVLLSVKWLFSKGLGISCPTRISDGINNFLCRLLNVKIIKPSLTFDDDSEEEFT